MNYSGCLTVFLFIISICKNTLSLPLPQQDDQSDNGDTDELALSVDDFMRGVAEEHESNGVVNYQDGGSLGGHFEGDIYINTENQNTQEEGGRFRDFQRNAIRNRNNRWQNGIVPYVISNQYTASERQKIAQAIEEYHRRTCIRFVPRTADHDDYLSIRKSGDGCFSTVGRTGGKQLVALNSDCFEALGVIIHEFMHAIGFWHEQSRTDRDEYIEIVWDNLDEQYRDQFQKYGIQSIDSLGEQYDYSSIMHYPRTAFSNNNQPTIVPLKDGADRMGQRNGFSETDLRKINKLYDCANQEPIASGGNSVDIRETGLPNDLQESAILAVKTAIAMGKEKLGIGKFLSNFFNSKHGDGWDASVHRNNYDSNQSDGGGYSMNFEVYGWKVSLRKMKQQLDDDSLSFLF